MTRISPDRTWRPGWAIAVSVVSIIIGLVPAVWGVLLISDNARGEPSGESAEAWGLALGQISLLLGGLALAPWALYWWYPRRVWFAVAVTASVTVAAFVSWILLA